MHIVDFVAPAPGPHSMHIRALTPALAKILAPLSCLLLELSDASVLASPQAGNVVKLGKLR